MNIEKIAVALLLVLVVVQMGLKVTPAQVRQQGERWRMLVVLVFANTILLPVVTAALCTALDVSAGMAFGLLLAAASPGGGTGSLLTSYAKGDLPFSLALLLLCAVVSIPVTPFAVSLLAPLEAQGQGVNWVFVSDMGQTLIWYQGLPLLGAMLFAHRWPRHAPRIATLVGSAGTLLLVGLIVGLTVQYGRFVFEVNWSSALVILVLVAFPLVMAIPFWSHGRAVQSAIVFTCGVRNLSSALLLAALYARDDRTSLIVMLQGLVVYVLAVPAIAFYRRTTSQAGPSEQRVDEKHQFVARSFE